MRQLLQMFLTTSVQSSAGSLVEESGLPLLELEQQVIPDWKDLRGATSFVEAMRMILHGSCSTLDNTLERSKIGG